MKKEIKIIALPTEKASNILKVITDKMGYRDRMQGSFEIHDSPWETNEDFEAHHIYITTSGTPKDGDWAITARGELFQATKENSHSIYNDRKVVATDDKNLLEGKCWCMKPQRGGCIECIKTIFPICPEFQQAWVREANKGTPIVDAIMEMELIPSTKSIEDAEVGDLVFNTHSSGGIINNLSDDIRVGIGDFVEVSQTGDSGHDTLDICGYKIYNGYKPKLSPQGYVTILPVKEKMFSREELLKFFNNEDHYTEGELGNSCIAISTLLNFIQ